jgi:hypothetical protein
MRTYCCKRMDEHLHRKCKLHRNRYDCPDALIAVSRGKYSLIIHDGGQLGIEINYCPWCGAKLGDKSPLKPKRNS